MLKFGCLRFMASFNIFSVFITKRCNKLNALPYNRCIHLTNIEYKSRLASYVGKLF